MDAGGYLLRVSPGNGFRRIEKQETMLENVPLSENIRNLIAGCSDFAVIGLVLLSLGSILLFMKVFKADFNQD